MTYYVATLAHYVLVEAPNEAEAMEHARPMLEKLRAEGSPPEAQRLPLQIRTVRPATADEVELMRFDTRMRQNW